MKVFAAVALAVLMAPAIVSADTIRLKDGSTIKGRVVKFSNNEFTVQLDSLGAAGGSRAVINIDDVDSIEFDSAGARSDSARDTGQNSGVRAQDPARAKPPSDVKSPAKKTPPADESEGDDDSLDSVRSDKTKGASSEIGNVQSTDVSVQATGEWVSTGVTLKIGQKVRITSTGDARFRGKTFGPDGIEEPDPGKLLRDANAGALIAVIGDDNDDFILVGKSKQFTATRNGRLYLAVNEGSIKDYSGSFRCRVEAEIGQAPAKRQ